MEGAKKADIPFIESGRESRLTTRVVNLLCQCTTAKVYNGLRKILFKIFGIS